MTRPTADIQAIQTTRGGGNDHMEAYEASASGLGSPPLDAAIGYKLRRAQLHVFQDFHETFSELKLRPTEFAVLAMIASTPGLKQTEVAERLGIKRANFVALMDSLERRKLAERRKGDHDRRSHSLHLTDEGMKFVTRMTELWQQHEGRMIERLGGEDKRDTLIELLNLLVDSPCGSTTRCTPVKEAYAHAQRQFEQIRRA